MFINPYNKYITVIRVFRASEEFAWQRGMVLVVSCEWHLGVLVLDTNKAENPEKAEAVDSNVSNGSSNGETRKGIDNIIQKVIDGSDNDEQTIKKLIKEKQEELSGLVSEEGAAYIVARELGVNLLKATKRQLKVKNLLPGLRSVDLLARVVRVFEPRDWSKGERSGKVASLILGDETGTVRLSLWNDEVDIIGRDKINEGDSVKISGAFVKMDNRGQPDLRLGRGKLVPVEEGKVTLPRPEDIQTVARTTRKKIKDLKDGDYGETMACLVQIFSRSRPFYEICPKCGGRVSEDNGKFECKDHGMVEPDYSMVVSGVIDDGTANIRAVFFRETAEKVLGKTVKDLRDELGKGKSQDEIFAKLENIGKDFIFQGRVKRNDLSGNIELIANDLRKVDVKEETNKLIEELKNN